MTMFHQGDERGPVPSYFLAEIMEVNPDTHTCSVQPLRGFEQYNNVILMRDIGNFSLPKVGDLCSVFWDNKNKPIINGYYPVFYEDQKDLFKYYFVQPGERMLQSDFGQKLLMNKQGEIFLTNWLSQGVEIEEKTGIVTIRTDTAIIDTAGVNKRSGYAKRLSTISKKQSSILSIEIGELTVASNIEGDASVVEDVTILSAIASSGEEGNILYESKVGSIIVEEGSTSAAGLIDVVTHSKTDKPLRSLTKYYADGTAEAVIIEIDINGNTNIEFPPTATNSGLSIEGILSNLLLHFKTIEIGGESTEGIDIGGESTTEVNIGALTDTVKALVWADVLTLLKSHTHPYTWGHDPGAGVTTPSSELTGVDDGTYETSITKAN